MKLAELTEHLGCVICRGILRDAHTIPDCLHSFCKSCIYRHFIVKGSRNCPKCNKLLSPRPVATLISDKKLQDIVDRIFPEFKAQEVIDEQEFYAKNNFKLKEAAPSGASTPETVNSGDASSQSASRSRSKAKKAPSVEPVAVENVFSRQIAVEAYPQQTNALALPELKFPFMLVSGNFKMSELGKLIHKRLRLEEDVQLEIACMGTAVGPELSALFILRTIWEHQNQKEPLVLHYRHRTL